MTGEEMERAIEFLLKSQANFEVRLDETNQQIARTERQLEIFTETQSQFIQAMFRFTESQDTLNTSMRQRQSELIEAQQRTEQRISELADAQQRTQQDISDLTKAVNNLIKFSSGNGNSRQE